MNIFENNEFQDRQKLECWVFRIAQKKWGITGRDCIKIFKKNDIFNIVKDMNMMEEINEIHIVRNIEELFEKNIEAELNKQGEKTSNSRNILYRTQKECRAINVMRDMVCLLAERKHLSFEKAFEEFAKTTMYEELFNYPTELWAQKPVCLLEIFDKWNTKK